MPPAAPARCPTWVGTPWFRRPASGGNLPPSPSPSSPASIPAQHFYFTHGYVAPEGPFVIGETTHSTTFPSAVQYGDVAFGVQFHPEKSSDAGSRLLRNFVSIVKGA